MHALGIYNWWYCFRKSEKTGQVATLITLAIAIIFLFVAVTLNISKVSQRKTVVSNAADGAAIQLASSLGSYANMLSQQYLDGKPEVYTRSFQTLFMILAAIVLAIVTGGAGGTALAPLAAVGSAVSAVGAGVNEFVFRPRIANGIQKQISRLPIGMQMSEQAIFYALRHSVDDSRLVLDDWDDDNDERTDAEGDHVRAFEYWYARRISLLRTLVDQTRDEDVPWLFDSIERFAQAAEVFRSGISEDETRHILVTQTEDEDAALPVAGVNGALITLLEGLENLGNRQINALLSNFWVRDAGNTDPKDREFNYDQVDTLSGHLNLFVLWATDLTAQHPDNAMLMSDMWMSQLYSPDQELGGLSDALQAEPWYAAWSQENQVSSQEQGRTWYQIWQEQIERIKQWQGQLLSVEPILEEMLAQEEAAEVPNPIRINELNNLYAQLQRAWEKLGAFQETVSEFNFDVVNFANATRYQDRDVLTNLAGPGLLARIASFAIPQFGAPGFAEYSWQDSLGWHHVRVVAISLAYPFKPCIIPNLQVELGSFSSGNIISLFADLDFTKISLVLKDYRGLVLVYVNRFDESTATSFAQRRRYNKAEFEPGSVPLWKFRYIRDAQAEGRFDAGNRDQALLRGMSSWAVADYSYDRLPSLLVNDQLQVDSLLVKALLNRFGL